MAITINGSGTISGLSVGGLPDGSVDADTLAAGAVTTGALPAGTILQVVNTKYTSTLSQSVGSGSTWAPSQLELNITPTSSSSKILIIANITCQSDTGRANMGLRRDGSIQSGVTVGDTSGSRRSATSIIHTDPNRPTSFSVTVLDSPATTSEITYSVIFSHGSSSSQGMYINKTNQDDDNSRYPRALSEIVAIEIGA